MPVNNTKVDVIENPIVLVHSGDDYFFRLENIINSSKKELHIQTYIFDIDTIGLRIIDALLNAANRKVKIYLLLDGFGSNSFSSTSVRLLKNNGINIRFFSPFFSFNSFYIGRRLHHKVVVSDGERMLIGGINIADKYCGSSNETPWLDYAVEIENNIAKNVQQICSNLYFKNRKVSKSKIVATGSCNDLYTIRILQNDWLNNKNEVQKEYLKAIENAKNEIVIVGSYFFPGRRITLALKRASKRNVPIKLIVSGISDVPVLRSASLYLYSILLKYNIEIYEWNKSVLHGKAAVIDGKWATVGSFNINNLSTFGSIEMNVQINSVPFSENYLSHLKTIIAQCTNLTKEKLLIRDGKLMRYFNFLSYVLLRLIVIIVIYFPKNRFLKSF